MWVALPYTMRMDRNVGVSGKLEYAYKVNLCAFWGKKNIQGRLECIPGYKL